MGLALFSPLGLQATIFYFIEDIIVMTNLFLLSNNVADALRNMAAAFRQDAWAISIKKSLC
ncbi:MAG: hypothetical protein R2865_07575 [Deinococcales bacterium]